MVRTRAGAPQRLAAVLVTGALALVLGGCGGGGTTNSGVSTRPGPHSSTSPSTTTSTTPSTTTSSTKPSRTSTSTSTNSATSSATASGNLDYATNPALLRAGALAEREVPHSTLSSIEAEGSGSRWEAQVLTPKGAEHTMVVSRHGTRILSGPTTTSESASDRAKHRRRLQDARLDYRQAAERATGAVPMGRITELDLDTYRGQTVWEAEVSPGAGPQHSLKIDARTGDVLANEIGTG
jgi:uncharacterized membrane protein YkoI